MKESNSKLRISFIGDVMLGRLVGSKFKNEPYNLLSEDVVKEFADSDFIIANLESPLAINAKSEGDHLQFVGNPEIIDQLDFVSAFSLSNNHITDCGIEGIDETIDILKSKNINYNGVFTNEYSPLVFSKNNLNISIITFTDMLNIPFNEEDPWHVLRMGDKKIFDLIQKEKKRGNKVILFAHVGMLFTRFPNPIVYNYLHECIDCGADVIVTCHSHCLGGMEFYKNALIFHSIGDFLMDGSSIRRRTAGILHLDIYNNDNKWSIVPTRVDDNLKVILLKDGDKDKILKRFKEVSEKIKNNDLCYEKFFKTQYKKELVAHSLSTISFLINERGLSGLVKILMKRSTEVFRTIKWASSDRSNVQRDDDAIKADRKKFSQEDLFGK